MLNDLNILFYDRLYPEINGAYLRTFNIAKLASTSFKNTTIYATDEKIFYDNTVNNVHIIQGKKFKNILDKSCYYYKGIFTNDFSLKTLDKTFTNVNDTLYQIESPYFYNLINKKRIKKYILDEHNVNWKLLEYPQKNLTQKFFNKLTIKRNKLIEINALENASYIFTCSDTDKEQILEEVPNASDKIFTIPNCINCIDYNNYLSVDYSSFERKTFNILFMGLLSYYPNTDAVNNICTKIAPYLDKNVKCIIVGKNPPNISKPANVTFTGYVNDVREYIVNSDVCIAPLRYGSGTRFKILEYMAMKKPVISTTKGAEGIDYTNGLNIIIEDDIDKFSDRIIELITNDKKRASIGCNAKKLVESKYDWNIYTDLINKIYRNIS